MQYPFVSKTLRDVNVPRESRRSHCCAMTIQTEGVGYDDLNTFLKNPSDLEFTIGLLFIFCSSFITALLELVKVEQPEDYEKESWQMDENEKLKKVPELKERGNAEFNAKKYEQAADYYAKAIGIIEQLMIK